MALCAIKKLSWCSNKCFHVMPVENVVGIWTSHLFMLNLIMGTVYAST